MNEGDWDLVDPTDRAEIAEDVRLHVAIGRSGFEQVLHGVVESRLDEIDDQALLERGVRDLVAREFAGHLAAQATWPAVTDGDRLSMAMLDLAMAGIVAREHYTCCTGCGVGEIRREAGDVSGARGYVFYHQQDAERAAGGGDVYLAFGAHTADAPSPSVPGDTNRPQTDGSGGADGAGVGGFGGVAGVGLGGSGEADGAGAGGSGDVGEVRAGGVEDRDEVIGGEIVRVLRGRGLGVEWSGDVGQRIRVRMDWRRRRFGWLAEYPGSGVEGEPVDGLRVTYCDNASVSREEPVVMSGQECRDLMLWMTPRDGNFICYEGRSGSVLQFAWERGIRLWAETPDVVRQRSLGRHVRVDEALAMIAALAEEDRITLRDLGELQEVSWT
ncbi:hypothetical protein SAMN05444920_103486 [Nonomuraea solani]|uniref:DUF6891 domain-containing protein n=1 Tax=Nonomuraea solani TaxID=1144553 RepID=A0A1H6BLJ9_9ACTN|nr:hypothetical protein [Nonomuraea solani]SEG61599.1 hypothetical protein SAMN05444920_103486 [Nonomuraea solani]